ncbi:ATP-dependent DNA helicase [Trichonephila inaurata madagascariensis]|uniref:ATP-dependent DNA helicase n=1 Tax=Trichonephila inaurata madagascariensis TaxID=2747483 RepID=A0A8X6YV06_9ARAC|nr:ATP-dependent DNA helicase [Trichonephila inaurata madagascariensis]
MDLSFTSLDPDGAVSLKNMEKIVNTERELLQAVFPNLPDFFHDHVWLCQRAILASQNQTVRMINKRLLSQIPGNAQIYKSINTVCDPKERGS